MRPLNWRSQGRSSSPRSPTEEPQNRRAGKRLHPDVPRPALTRIRNITIALFALAMLAVTAPAAQADYHQAIKDCYDDGVLQGTYTPRELRQAISHLPSSISEYSDCSDVLSRALAAGRRPIGAARL